MAENSLEHLPRTRKEAIETGSKRYFTGKPCKRGHVTTRFSSTKQCSECLSDQVLMWRAGNNDKLLASGRKSALKRRLTNPEQVRASKRKSWVNNLEKCRKQSRDWGRKNAQAARERARNWHANNLDRARANRHNRRSIERSADGSHTASDIVRIRAAQRDRCAMPGCQIKLNGKGHLDHIIALSKGGSNWPNNLQFLCAPCNLSKHDRDPIEFAQSLGLLV